MTYEAWRISFQSSEQAARAAFEESCKRGNQIAKALDIMTEAQIKQLNTELLNQ